MNQFLSGPLVTVYIPCRNYGRFLKKAVNSVIDQLYDHWELIIIDEGSDDNTLVIAEEYRSFHPDRISVIHNSDPLGLQRVANTILDIAKGVYIMRLDADDWLDEGALLLMVAKLEGDSSLGLVYGNYYYTDIEENILGVERRHKLGLEDTSYHVPPHGACTLVRTRSLKAVGGYSENVKAQDGWDLWFKLIHRTNAGNLDLPLFYYRQHDSSLSKDSSRILKARSQVFKNARKTLDGGYTPTILAVVPVRESYPGWDGVPYRKLQDKSLLQLTLDGAAAASSVSHILVSSESRDVLEYSNDLISRGLLPNHMTMLRSHKKATHKNLPAKEILSEAVEEYKNWKNAAPDIVLFLSIHAPNRKSHHIEEAINLLLVTEADSVFSVSREREPIFSHGRDGLNLLNPGRFAGLNYEKEQLYRFNGSIIALWSDVLMNQDNIFGERIGYLEMSSDDSIQIKNERDYESMRATYP